jgi:hypothetical protein
MSRFYTNLGNLAPSYRLVVLASMSLAAWLMCGPSAVQAGCGDYVKITNPQFPGQMAEHMASREHSGAMPVGVPSDSSPAAPCRGPNCGQRAPILPVSPVPTVVRSIAEQWADLPRADDEVSSGGGLPLADSSERPSDGHPSLLKRPPRA